MSHCPSGDTSIEAANTATCCAPVLGTVNDPFALMKYAKIPFAAPTYNNPLLGVTTIDSGTYPAAMGELLTAVNVPVPMANPPSELATWFAT